MSGQTCLWFSFALYSKKLSYKAVQAEGYNFIYNLYALNTCILGNNIHYYKIRASWEPQIGTRFPNRHPISGTNVLNQSTVLRMKKRVAQCIGSNQAGAWR